MAGEDFLALAEELDFILGYDYVERKCGASSMRAGTEYLWIEPPFSVSLHPKFKMEKKTKYLLLTHANWDADHGCVYTAGEVGGNTAEVDVGPVSDPSRADNFTVADSGVAEDGAPTLEPVSDGAEASKEPKPDAKDDSGSVFGGPSNAKAEEGKSCFPATARVRLADGSTVPMHALAPGDSVQVSTGGATSDVFMFTHRDRATQSEFVTLETAAGVSVTLTPGHYLYVNGALAAAKTAAVGDALMLAGGSLSAITKVSRSVGTGLYNPQTLHGDLIVDGVLVSTYTTAVEPGLAHALLLAPARALYRARLGRLLVGLLDGGASTLVRWLPSGVAAE
jgi:hypothetical protein